MSEINELDFIQNCLYIITKDGRKVLFKLNEPQMRLYNEVKRQMEEGQPVRIIILKARQMGFSTLVEALIFIRTILNHYIKSGIITHLQKSTKALFKMSKRFYDNLPFPEDKKPKRIASNAFEMVFDTPDGKGLDSSISCMTATDDSVGRGDTYINLHLSEVAFWKNFDDVYTSLMQCVPDTPNSMVILESTANGYNEFKDIWDMAVRGENDYTPLFFAWWEMSTYKKRYDGHPLDKDEIELKERFNLSNEQLQWRKWKIRNECKGDINKFKQEYPSYPEEAFLYSGTSVFDVEKVQDRLKNVKEPIKRGRFIYSYDGLKPYNIRWENDEKGEVWIYEDVKPLYPYVIGGDTAGDGSDAFLGQVIDNTNGKQVAKLKHSYDSDLYAREMYCLGMYYNEALLGIESNYDSFPIKELARFGYTNMFVREIEDTITGRYQERFGFKTTTITRPIIISNLVQIVRETPELITDRETLQEMVTFVKNEKGKPEAILGKHDDCVMALAIAYYVRTQQKFTPKDIKENKKENWVNKAIKKERKQTNIWY